MKVEELYVSAYSVTLALGISFQEVRDLIEEKKIPTEPRTGRPLRSEILKLMEEEGIKANLLRE